MKNKKLPIILAIAIPLFTVALIFFITTTKKNRKEVTPITKNTEVMEEMTLEEGQQPYISLKPQSDGHRLDLKITNIPSIVSEIEYDLIYTAQDENLEIEKGIGGTAEIENQTFERDLLLGTESCTNGCKYKYDEGITGGTLILNLLTEDNKSAYFEAPFVFANGVTSLALEDITITAKAKSKSEYFILIKNYQSTYSVFSSANGIGTVSSIDPSTITKEDMTTIAGDYLLK
jgi:hypothetical protein